MKHKGVKLYEIPISGDMLTCERVRGAQGLRTSHDHADEQLRGFVPFVEDWHTRQTLVMVRHKQ